MSREGMRRTESGVSSLIGSFAADLEDALPLQGYVKERLEELEARLEGFLQQMTEDMALEVEREQQHLMLMQDQVFFFMTSHAGNLSTPVTKGDSFWFHAHSRSSSGRPKIYPVLRAL
jgi:hypothetical protein